MAEEWALLDSRAIENFIDSKMVIKLRLGTQTDHANLKYYQEPRKIGPRIMGYIPELAQYNLLLEYKPGVTN